LAHGAAELRGIISLLSENFCDGAYIFRVYDADCERLRFVSWRMCAMNSATRTAPHRFRFFQGYLTPTSRPLFTRKDSATTALGTVNRNAPRLAAAIG
jgi:hypothetical protein